MKEGITVSRFKMICSVVLVISVVMVTVCLGQSVIFRTPDAYQFYFNDSQCVDRLYTSLTSSEMADEIASFMNSFRPEEFQVNDNTGYDELPIFDSRDSYNMVVLKKTVDISGIFCVVGLILMVAVYIWFLREDEKKLLRRAHLIGAGISLAVIAVQAAVMSAPGLRTSWYRLWGMRAAAADSRLAMIMGDAFWSSFTVFLTGMCLIILLVLTYINYRITRPPRIFF